MGDIAGLAATRCFTERDKIMVDVTDGVAALGCFADLLTVCLVGKVTLGEVFSYLADPDFRLARGTAIACVQLE
jgi:hypothetical protein